MQQQPIFVHSLYRSGSTWIFDRFRHATHPYWCYQEPYHEATIWLQSNPDGLLAFDQRAAASLRHPLLDRPYFAEVHSLREHVAPLFQKCISFDSFFETEGCPAFHAYTRALIELAPHRPMLQCCRSFGRVPQIRREHGGVHVHLWRNPRDQWWSYQINNYFDTASLAILQADALPAALQKVADLIGLRRERRATFDEEYTRLLRFPIDAKGRYLAFYALWLYSQLNNFDQADCNLSIDALSADPAALESAMERLRALGIDGVDLSGCSVPHSVLGPADDAFFEDIEAQVRQLFIDAGSEVAAIERATERQRAAQALVSPPHTGALVEQGMRARSAALRYADALKAARAEEQAAEQHAAALEAQVHAVDEALRAENDKVAATRAELDAERARAAALDARAAQAEQRYEHLAVATQATTTLAQSQVQLAQQHIELAQAQAREMRADAERLVDELRARLADAQAQVAGMAQQLLHAEQHMDDLGRRLDERALQQAAALQQVTEHVAASATGTQHQIGQMQETLGGRFDVGVERFNTQMQTLGTALEAWRAAQAGETAAATNQLDERLVALQAQQQEAKVEVGARIDAQTAHMQAWHAQTMALGPAVDAGLDALKRNQAEMAAHSLRALESHAQTMEQAMLSMRAMIEQAHRAEREAANTRQRAELDRLERQLRTAEERSAGVARDMTALREQNADLLAFRHAMQASRLGRWLASRHLTQKTDTPRD